MFKLVLHSYDWPYCYAREKKKVRFEVIHSFVAWLEEQTLCPLNRNDDTSKIWISSRLNFESLEFILLEGAQGSLHWGGQGWRLGLVDSSGDLFESFPEFRIPSWRKLTKCRVFGNVLSSNSGPKVIRLKLLYCLSRHLRASS